MTHYKNWINLPLSTDEKRDFGRAERDFRIQDGGAFHYAQISGLKLQFTKATLRLEQDEVLEFKSHKFADNQPFYRLTLEAPSDMNGLKLLRNLRAIWGAGDAELGPETSSLSRDFRLEGPIQSLSREFTHIRSEIIRATNPGKYPGLFRFDVDGYGHTPEEFKYPDSPRIIQIATTTRAPN